MGENFNQQIFNGGSTVHNNELIVNNFKQREHKNMDFSFDCTCIKSSYEFWKVPNFLHKMQFIYKNQNFLNTGK
jgi:hypothetical protein